MTQKKNNEGYLWILRVSTNDCTKECYAGKADSTRKWCANTTNHIVQEEYEKFMKSKPDYTQEKLLEKVPKEYHSMINVFIKHNADTLTEHQKENYTIQLEEDKSPPFVRNYKPLLNQENVAMIKYIQEHLGKSFI